MELGNQTSTHNPKYKSSALSQPFDDTISLPKSKGIFSCFSQTKRGFIIIPVGAGK